MAGLTRKNAASAIALAAIALCVYQKRQAFLGIAAVLTLAGAFTLMLLPLEARLERRGWSASLASLTSVLALLLAALLLVSAFIPYLIAQSADLARRVTPTLSALLSRYGGTLAQLGFIGADRSGLPEMLASSASRLTSALARGSMAFAAQAGQLVFSLVIAYYLLSERRAVGNHLLLCVPLKWRAAFLCALRGCKNAILSYLSGLFKTSLFVGAATFAGLALLGIRDALLLSVFMGVLEVLPYVGPVLAAVPIVLTALPLGVTRAALALGVVVLVQQAEGNFISPYFTAASTSIHPLAALVSVFALGSLLGVWGILLAIPLVVTARSVLWSVQQAARMRAGEVDVATGAHIVYNKLDPI